MKKVFQKLLLLSIVGSIGFLYSCGEDEEPVPSAVPTVSVSASVGGTSLAEGGEVVVDNTVNVEFTVTISAEGGFNTLRVTDGTAPNEFTRNDLNVAAGATSASTTITYEVADDLIGSTVTITFTVVDDEDQTGQSTFSFVVTEPPSPPAKVVTAILLAAPTGDLMSQTFYSVSQNKTYSRDDVESTTASVSPLIDFGYYYGATDNASLSAPDEYPIWDLASAGWGTLNETILELTNITAAEYLEIVSTEDVALVFDEIDISSSNGTVTNLKEGDVLVIETAEGDRGLILIGAITGTDGSNGSISLEIKLDSPQ